MVVIADTVDLNQKIENRTFTVGWLLDSLRTNDKEYIKRHGDRAVREVTSCDVSGGKGFISIVAKCVVKFVDSSDDSDVYSTVLKIPGFESLEDANSKCEGGEQWFDDEGKKEMTQLHVLECQFYNELAPILDVPLPKVYKTVDWHYGKQEGCLHMEDLTKRGKTISYFDNINLTQVRCFIRHLAHWHKNILSADEKDWKHISFFEKMGAFKNAIVAFDKMSQAFMETSSMKPMLAPIVEKYRKFAMNFDYFTYASKDGIEEIGIKQVIVHGDMHSGNMLFAIDENGDVQNEIAAFVDWQTMHVGSPMEDLARFLCLCADGVVRRQAEVFAIQYYYDCLVKEFGDESKVPYTMEQLQKAYNLAFSIQGIFSLGIVPFFMSVCREPSQTIKDAYRDYGTLKALHMLEDIDRLMSGEMKDIFEKYGQ